MNCNTPFHNFWKNLNVDAFIPCTLLLILITGILYCYSFNTEYLKVYETAIVVSYNECEEPMPCPNGNKDCKDHTCKYAVIKYKSTEKSNVIHTAKIPIPCSNINLRIHSDNPTKLQKCNVYNDYVGIFFTSNNSSKKMDKDLYILE